MKRLQTEIVVYLTVFCLLVGLASFFGRPRAAETMAAAGKQRTVILDPGHGGEDGGAVGPGGQKESDLNLEISLRLRDLLLLLGADVRMTRETDVSVCDSGHSSIAEKKVSDLKNRVRLVNETPDAVLISIHQNFFTEEKYSGAQVFFAQTAGSSALAETMQDLLREGLDPGNRRASKPAQEIYLLEKVTCPAVLIECGFLSNGREAALLGQTAYQKKLAAVIAAGIAGEITKE